MGSPWLRRTLNRLEALSPRERVLLVLGLPLVLLGGGERLLFSPWREQAAAARQQARQQQGEARSLEAVLAALPAPAAAVPAAEDPAAQRLALQRELDAARAALGPALRWADWGQVVRAAAPQRPGLAPAQLRALPAEPLFTPPVTPVVPAAPAGPPAAAPAALQPLYRHRLELTLRGEVMPVLQALQALRQAPPGLHWQRLQLSVAPYPQASLQLSLFTVSPRPATPFETAPPAADAHEAR